MFKSLKKLASLALVTTMIFSPLQVFAESGTGSGGSGGVGGQDLPAGKWAISEAYKASGTKVSLAKSKYKSYTDSEYGRGDYMRYTPLGAGPGYSLDATQTTGTTPIYFMGNSDSRVKNELVADTTHQDGYKLVSGVTNYTVQDSSSYLANTDIDPSAMQAVITALSIDYKNNRVHDINSVLRLPRNKTEADNQTENQKKWTTNVFRALATIMLQEYGSNINSNVKLALEGIAKNGQYVAGDGDSAYEYFFVLEPFITVNTGGVQFLLTPNTLMQIYMQSDGYDIRQGVKCDNNTNNSYETFWNVIKSTPFWRKGTGNSIINYMAGKGSFFGYSPDWEGRSSLAGLLWYQGPTTNPDGSRAGKTDYRLGFGTLRPTDFISAVRQAEIYYAIGDVSKPERSGGNMITLSSDYVNGLQKKEMSGVTYGQVDSSLSADKNSMVSVIYSTTYNTDNSAIKDNLQIANTISLNKLQLPDAAHIKGTTGSLQNGAYISVGTGANSKTVMTSKNPQFADYYLDKSGMVIHTSSVNIQFNSETKEIPAGTAYVVDKAIEEAAKTIKSRLGSTGDNIVVTRTDNTLMYGEGQLGAFSYKVLNGIEVDKLVQSKVAEVQKSKEQYTHPNGSIYAYDGTYIGQAPSTQQPIGSYAQGRAGRIVNQIVAMTATNKKELANTLIVQGANKATGLELKREQDNSESRNGDAPLQYAMTYDGVPVIFQFIRKNGNNYEVLRLENGQDRITTNQKAAALFTSVITLPTSVKNIGNVKRAVIKAADVPMNNFLNNVKADLDNYSNKTSANGFVTPIFNLSEVVEDGVPSINISARATDIASGQPISIVMVVEDKVDQKLIKVYGDDKGKHDKTTITDITEPTLVIANEGNYKVNEIFVSRIKAPNININTTWAEVVSSKDGTWSSKGPDLINIRSYGKEENIYVYVRYERVSTTPVGQVGDKTSQYISFQIPFNELGLNPINITALEGDYGYGRHIWSHLSLGHDKGCVCPGRHSCSGRYDGNTLFDGKCACYGRHSCIEAGESVEDYCGHDDSAHYIGDNCYCPGTHSCSGCYCPGHSQPCTSSCYETVSDCSHTCDSFCDIFGCDHVCGSSCEKEVKTCDGDHVEYCPGDDCSCYHDHFCDGCMCAGHSCSEVGYACKYPTNTHSCTEWGETGCYCPSRHSCTEWGWDGCVCPGHGCEFKRIIDMDYDIEIKETEKNDKKVIADDNISEFRYDYYNNHKSGTIGYQTPSTYPRFYNVHHTAVAHRGYDVVTIAKYKENGSAASNSLGKLGYPTANTPKGTRSSGSYTKKAKWIYDVYGIDPYTHTQCYVKEAEEAGVTFEHDHEPKFTDDAPDLPFTLTFQQTRGVLNNGIKAGTSYQDPTIKIAGTIFRDEIDSVVYSKGNIQYHPYVKMLWEKAPVNGNKAGTEDLPVMVLADHISTFRPNNTITIAMNNKGRSLVLTSKQWSTHREATNGNLGWDKAGQVLPGGATFKVERTNKPLEVGLKIEMVYVPDDIVNKTPEYNLNDYSYTNVSNKINDIAKDVEKQLSDTAKLEMKVNTNWRGDFRDGVTVDKGKTVNLNRTVKLSNEDKYWLEISGNSYYETSKEIAFTINTTVSADYLIRSNVNGGVELLKNGRVVKQFAKNVTNQKIIEQLPYEFATANNTTKFIENFLNTVDRNIGPGASQWYNEAWDGIGVKVYEATYTIDLGRPAYRIAVLDPKLTPEQSHMGEAFGKAFAFGLVSANDKVEINTDGQHLELTGIKDAICTQQVYIPNATVMDINQ